VKALKPVLAALCCGWATVATAQSVMNNGRWFDANGKAVQAFGVNYAAPFAHAFRRMEQAGIDVKKSIDQDVYHFARLGFDGYRVHVWDVEISDKKGHLIKNEHLDHFDYLVARLKQRGISILLTPMFLGENGYPEKAIKESGFAQGHHKKEMVTDAKFAAAQFVFIGEFLNHVNPYTGIAYKDESSILGIELVNEPWHDGTPKQIAAHLDQLIAAAKQTGCTTPLFYNLSQNPYLRELYYERELDGFTFQWYPAGLNQRPLYLNLLPQTNDYSLFFGEDPELKQHAKAAYEIGLASVPSAYAYPLIAKTLREQGFQFAAYFSYDPIAIAAYNSEYPTHYLNLAYTPKHAINLMIAAEVFRGNDDFSIKAEQNQSLLDDGTLFYYSNGTENSPSNPATLRRVAACGTSPLFEYTGDGAYFLDKLDDGSWRLEVMPDPYLLVENPYYFRENGDPVADVQWNLQDMTIRLPDLGSEFSITAQNPGNPHAANAKEGRFKVIPGTYLLSNHTEKDRLEPNTRLGRFALGEFAAPKQRFPELKPYQASKSAENDSVLFNAANRYENNMLRAQGTKVKIGRAEFTRKGFEIELKPKTLTWGEPFAEWLVIQDDPVATSAGQMLEITGQSTTGKACPITLLLQTQDGTCFAANTILPTKAGRVAIDLSQFTTTQTPRMEQNPSFLPVTTDWTGPSKTLEKQNIRAVHFRLGSGLSESARKADIGISIQTIRLVTPR